MVSALILIAGLVVVGIVSVILSIALEMVLSIGELHAVLGGFGVFMFTPLALLAALVASVVGLTADAAGWALFFYPLWGCLAAFAVFALLGFASKLISR